MQFSRVSVYQEKALFLSSHRDMLVCSSSFSDCGFMYFNIRILQFVDSKI